MINITTQGFFKWQIEFCYSVPNSFLYIKVINTNIEPSFVRYVIRYKKDERSRKYIEYDYNYRSTRKFHRCDFELEFIPFLEALKNNTPIGNVELTYEHLDVLCPK